jgi:hypothetical protein
VPAAAAAQVSMRLDPCLPAMLLLLRHLLLLLRTG